MKSIMLFFPCSIFTNKMLKSQTRPSALWWFQRVFWMDGFMFFYRCLSCWGTRCVQLVSVGSARRLAPWWESRWNNARLTGSLPVCRLVSVVVPNRKRAIKEARGDLDHLQKTWSCFHQRQDKMYDDGVAPKSFWRLVIGRFVPVAFEWLRSPSHATS